MKIPASFEKLKRKFSIRRKKNLPKSKRITSAPFLFKDDNIVVTFSPVKAITVDKRCIRFRSSPNIPKKSVSFDTSNLCKMTKTDKSLYISRPTSLLNVTRYSSPLNMSRNISTPSSSLNISSHSSSLNVPSRNLSRIAHPSSSFIRRTSLDLVVDTSSCELVLGLDFLENDKCSSFSCCDDVCLVCSMIRPELRAPHFPGNLSPELLRTFF